MLTTDGQTFPVSQASVAGDIHESSYIHGSFAPEVTFNGKILVDIIPDTRNLLI